MHPARAGTLVAHTYSSESGKHRLAEWRIALVMLCLLAIGAISLHAGTFAVFGPKNYVRGTGAPVTVTDNFSVLNPATQYTLKAFNGGLQNSETELVSSSVVTLNGVQVLGPSDFNQNVAEVDVPVTLHASNTISVQVRGQPDGVLTILIVGVDNQPPTIKASVSPVPNAVGWNNTNVTVKFTCADAISGISTCPPSQTVTTEGANQIISGTAIDNAGNTASTSVTLNISKMPPRMTAAGLPAPNANGWNNSNVTVNFTCAPTIAPVAACPQPQTVSTEGAAQIISGTATDVAGNSASASVTINLEKTPPTITAKGSPVPNAAGWNNSNVTVSFQCGTSLSGGVQCPVSQTVSEEGAGQVISGTVSDTAGNQASASVTINLDKTPPTLSFTAPTNGSAVALPSVTINGSASDQLSGLASVSCAGTLATISGSNFTCLVPIQTGSNSISVQATDVAGNTVQTSVSVQGGIPILVSVSPNAGQQGQQNLSVAIGGQFTNFVQGTTVANFGAGVTIVSFSVNSATSATALLDIDPAAAGGARTVTVQTGSEIVSLPNGFSIQANLAPGVSAGPDQVITVPFDEFESNSVSPFWTAFGPGTVNLTNTLAHSGTQSLLTTESASAPYYAWLRHDFGGQQFGSVSVYFHSGVFCCGSNSFLSIGNEGGTGAEEAGILQDSAGNYSLFFIPPGTAGQFVSLGSFSQTDWHLLEIDAEASGTIFKVDNSLVYSNPTPISFQYVFIGTEAGSGGGSAYFDDFRTSIASTALSGTVSDDGLPVGSTLSTSWTSAGGPGNVTFATPTLSFPDVAGVANPVSTAATFSAPGSYKLTLTASDSQLTTSSTVNVTVNPPPLSLLTVSPSIVQSGQQTVSVAITGLFTSFVQGTSTADFGAGVSVVSLIVNTPEGAIAVLNVDPAAVPGPRNVTVTTGTEVVTLPNGLMVTAPVIVPALVTVLPNSGQQGQQNLSVSLTGQNTHFAQGITIASFGTGITVVSLTVSSQTSATAVLNIDPAGALGSQNVNITTGTEMVTLTNGFSITAGTPSLSVNAGANQTISQTWDLLVPDYRNPPYDVLRFDGRTGAFLNSFASGAAAGMVAPSSISYGPDANIYVSSQDPLQPTGDAFDKISRFNGAAGAFIDTFAPQGTGGTFTFGPDGNLYLVNSGIDNVIKRFDGRTGASLGPLASGFNPAGQLAFGPDGQLYVADKDRIVKIDSQTGSNLGPFTSPGAGGLTQAAGLVFGPDGDLYVSQLDVANVLRFDGKTGAFKSVFVASGSSANHRLSPIAFGPDGKFYVGSLPSDSTGGIYRYDGKTGAFIDWFVPNGSGGLFDASGFMFRFRSITANLSGSVTAQFLLGAPVTSWSQVSGPGTVTFANASSPSTMATFSVPGTYVLRLSASASSLSAFSDVTITATTPNQPPTVNAGPNQTVSLSTPATLSGTISDDGLPSPHVLTAIWSVVSGPGTVAFGNVNFPSTTATFSAPGTFILSLTASDGMLSSSATVTITVNAAVIPIITSITPNTGQQGQQNLSVAITGQNTNFAQGTTTASFGAGITVASLTVNSSASATAVLNINPAAALGARDVTVTTGSEIVLLTGSFSVLPGNQAPVVSANAGCSATISMLPAQMTFTEFASPSLDKLSGDIVQGPDCNFWFAENTANKIGRITPTGTIAEFPIPTPNSYLIGITLGPDGNVWFTESHGPNIGRITPSGAITEFPLSGGLEPVRITSGPDGNLWFAAEDRACATKSVIDRMTTAGVITEFPLRATACPGTPIVGPDSAIWFTELPGGIGRITTAGAITEFSIPTPSSTPVGLTVGPDGNLWFTEEAGNQIGRITPTGVVNEFPLPTTNGYPTGITTGPDRNLWFLENHSNKVARITPAGVITEFSLPAGAVNPDWIIGTPDGNLWFTSVLGSNFGIGKFNPTTGVGLATLTGTVTDDGLPAGAALSATWNVVRGPGPVTFSNPTLSFPDVASQTDSVTTQATFTTPGTYVLSLSGSDTQLTGTANVTVTVNPALTPSIVSVSPNSGQLGQQNLSVILTGQSTS